MCGLTCVMLPEIYVSCSSIILGTMRIVARVQMVWSGATGCVESKADIIGKVSSYYASLLFLK
jgi:hypothetical protein